MGWMGVRESAERCGQNAKGYGRNAGRMGKCQEVQGHLDHLRLLRSPPKNSENARLFGRSARLVYFSLGDNFCGSGSLKDSPGITKNHPGITYVASKGHTQRFRLKYSGRTHNNPPGNRYSRKPLMARLPELTSTPLKKAHRPRPKAAQATVSMQVRPRETPQQLTKSVYKTYSLVCCLPFLSVQEILYLPVNPRNLTQPSASDWTVRSVFHSLLINSSNTP